MFIALAQHYRNFTIQLTDESMISNHPIPDDADDVPLSAAWMGTEAQVIWADGDVSLYPATSVRVFITHDIAGEQP